MRSATRGARIAASRGESGWSKASTDKSCTASTRQGDSELCGRSVRPAFHSRSLPPCPRPTTRFCRLTQKHRPIVIEVAYKRLIRLNHPDVNRSPDANQRTVELNEAHEVLHDPKRRAEYDRGLRRERQLQVEARAKAEQGAQDQQQHSGDQRGFDEQQYKPPPKAGPGSADSVADRDVACRDCGRSDASLRHHCDAVRDQPGRIHVETCLDRGILPGVPQAPYAQGQAAHPVVRDAWVPRHVASNVVAVCPQRRTRAARDQRWLSCATGGLVCQTSSVPRCPASARCESAVSGQPRVAAPISRGVRHGAGDRAGSQAR
ncbi:MAG: J domain-containing protein [Anaerolineae bacterium]